MEYNLYVVSRAKLILWPSLPPRWRSPLVRWANRTSLWRPQSRQGFPASVRQLPMVHTTSRNRARLRGRRRRPRRQQWWFQSRRRRRRPRRSPPRHLCPKPPPLYLPPPPRSKRPPRGRQKRNVPKNRLPNLWHLSPRKRRRLRANRLPKKVGHLFPCNRNWFWCYEKFCSRRIHKCGQRRNWNWSRNNWNYCCVVSSRWNLRNKKCKLAKKN